MCLNTWSQLVEMFVKVVRPSGGGAAIQEVGHWGRPGGFTAQTDFLLTLTH